MSDNGAYAAPVECGGAVGRVRGPWPRASYALRDLAATVISEHYMTIARQSRTS